MIPRSFGNVRLAVAAEHRAVGIHNHHGIVKCIVGALEYADRQYHAELARDAAEVFDGRMRLQGLRELQMPRDVVLAEIRRLEQLLYENHLGAECRRLANQFLGTRDIGIAIPTAGHLSGRHRYLAHERYAT